MIGAVLAVAAVAYLALSDGMEATRYFNHGVRNYKDEKFDLAARQFQRAAELSPNATTAYNLALARWADATDAAEKAEDGDAEQEEAERSETDQALAEKAKAARKAIADALENYELEEDQVTNLIYCDGAILALEGKTGAARARLREAVEERDDFKAALVELVKLDAGDGGEISDPAKLLLVATADAEKLEIVEKRKNR